MSVSFKRDDNVELLIRFLLFCNQHGYTKNIAFRHYGDGTFSVEIEHRDTGIERAELTNDALQNPEGDDAFVCRDKDNYTWTMK